MLTRTYKEDSVIYLTLAPDADPKTPIGELLEEGIEIYIGKIRDRQASIGVEAPKALLIDRGE